MSENPYFKLSTKTEEDWHKLRSQGLGGSDAASILGLNIYKSPYTVWLEKTNRVEPEDLSGNQAVHWGNRLEDIIAEEFKTRHTDYRITNINQTFKSKKHQFMLANIDREITDKTGRKGILEIKTVGHFRADDWAEGVPDYYTPQMIHYLAVTGYEFGYFACLIGGNDYREYYFERDEKDIDFLIEYERQFWTDHVLTGIPPKLIGNPNESQALLNHYHDQNDEIALAHDLALVDGIINKIQNYKKEIDKITKEKREQENLLKAIVKNDKGVKTDVYRVLWLRSDAKTFNKDKFKDEHADLFEQFSEVKKRDLGLRIYEIKA